MNHKLWWSIGVGFLGILLILKPGAGIINLGSLFGIGAGFVLAVSTVVMRILAPKDNPYTILFYMFLCSLILSLPVGIFYWMPPNFQTIIPLLGVGLTFGLGQFFFVVAYRYAKASHLGPFSYASIVFAVCFSWIFWNEVPDYIALIGILLVCGGGILTVLQTRDKN